MRHLVGFAARPAVRSRLAVLATASGFVAAGCLYNVVDPLAPALHGTVLSTSGHPVQDVQVALPAQGITARTAADGRFTIQELPRGDLDVWIQAFSTRSSLTLDPLSPGVNYEMSISLDDQGDVASLRLTPSPSGSHTSGAQVYNALTRPENAGNLRGRAAIEGVSFIDGDQELEIDMESMDAGSTYEVYLQGGEGIRYLGSVAAGLDGRAEFDYYHVASKTDSEPLIGEKIQVCPKGDPQVQFHGVVPQTQSGRRKGSGELTRTASAPEGAEGLIKVKGTPPGRSAPDMDSFEIRVHGLEANTVYEVCVGCNALKSTAGTAGCDAGTFGGLLTQGGTVQIGVPAFTSTGAIEVPLLVRTGPTETLSGFKLGVEFSSACVTSITAVAGSAIPSSGSVQSNILTTVSGDTPGMDRTLRVLGVIVVPGECLAANMTHEVARLRITPAGSPSPSCCLAWNLAVNQGIPETSLTDCASTEAPVGAGSALPAPPNCVLLPSPLTCFATFSTDHKGDGRLRVRQLKGDVLPCDVEHVQELQGRVVEVHELSTGVAVLVGTVPGLRP